MEILTNRLDGKVQSVSVCINNYNGSTTLRRKLARLTDQCGSNAFSCSPFNIHARHIWPTSNIRHLL